MSNKTVVMQNNFRGTEMFSIYKTDAEGKAHPEVSKPVVNFGATKAKYILEHLDDLRAFVEANKK